MVNCKSWALSTAVAFRVCAAAAHGATISEDLSFIAEDSLFGTAPIGDFSVGPASFGVKDLAEVHYSAAASSGTVRADVQTRLRAVHPDRLSFGEAVSTPVGLSLERGRIDLPDPFPSIPGPYAIGRFHTEFGIEAELNVEVFGAVDIRLLNIDGLLSTSATSLSFTTDPFGVVANEPFNDRIKDSDKAKIASKGNIVKVLGAKFGAKASVFLTQSSKLSFGDLIGTVEARHEDGTLVTEDFALDRSDEVLMNLQREGLWSLSLTSITVDDADFSSDFGLGIGGKACVIVCAKIKPGSLPIGSSSFGLDFSKRSMDLATILVTPPIVPIPAGLPLLLSGFGALAVFRHRRTARS